MRAWLAVAALAALVAAGAAGAYEKPMSTGGAVAPGPASVKGKSGKARYEIRGCLAVKGVKGESEEEASRPYELKPGQRSIPLPPSVEPAPGGARVRHPFTHACCLKGAVKAVKSHGVWEVREHLSGMPCRCICSSTVETFLSLPRGTHRVRLVLYRGEDREVAGEWTVEAK